MRHNGQVCGVCIFMRTMRLWPQPGELEHQVKLNRDEYAVKHSKPGQ